MPDRLAFLQRLAEARHHSATQASAAQHHLHALEARLAQARHVLALGHTGTARAFLEIARKDFDAALSSLPQL